MSEIKIMDERPVSMLELRGVLEKIEKRDKELGSSEKKTYDYLNSFVKIDKKKAEEIKKKVEELNIPRLKDRHVIKIMDIMPNDIESLRATLSGENITIKQEDLDKIVEVMKKL